MDRTTYRTRSASLAAPRRNSYFYGKLLDVFHFDMEQEYGIRKRWLLNRLTLGEGVLCGLRVEPVAGELRVMPGVAIDGLGREIVVPVRSAVDPWVLTDACGRAADTLLRAGSHTVELCVAYAECATDYSPVLVTDCNTREDCAAGTTVESFSLVVKLVENVDEDAPDPAPDLYATICEALGPEHGRARAADRRHWLCKKHGELGAGCDVPSEDPCVCLATISLNDDQIVKVDSCSCRRVVYSNAALLELILCLADRVEQCCDRLPTREPLTVTAVDFRDGRDTVIATLDPQVPLPTVESLNVVRIHVAFNRPVARSSITTCERTTDTASMASFLVIPRAGITTHVPPPLLGTIEPDPATERTGTVTFVKLDAIPFSPGTYAVTLFGDIDPSGSRPAISDDQGERLDGEGGDLPSGDGSPGGNFRFEFEVKAPARLLAVSSVTILTSGDAVLARMENPRDPLVVEFRREPTNIEVEFIGADLDLASMIDGQTFVVTEVDESTGQEQTRTASHFNKDARTVQWSVNSPLQPGRYRVVLKGDGPSVIRAVDGSALDGDLSRAQLPSGDGQPGGDFRFTLEVVR